MPQPDPPLNSTRAWSRASAFDPEASTAPPVSHVSSVDVELLARKPWKAGHVFLDEFEVEDVLGQGGMGMVYLVRQQATRKPLAVKRARLTHADSRRQFLAELQLWMDLPAHPHLAPCRFFRTVEDEVVIFTDLATGGSLADWISKGKLRRLADVLDAAIQVAWGLHALHERGLVHQDVKPANVLMADDGTAKVADFGLARARARVHTSALGDSQSVLVTGGAMTPAYCSPEQASGRQVSRRTDVWSWGVLLMEMFIGRVPCCELGGPLAPDVLEGFLRTAAGQKRVEVMPPGVVAVAQLCFAADPGARWPSLADAATELASVYRQCVGTDYKREQPALDETLTPLGRQGGRWEPPRKWLTFAFQAAGRDPTEIDAVLPPPAATRRAQAVADLSAYEEARRMLEKLVASGEEDLRSRLGIVCVQKALVHGSVGDWPAALELFDRALTAWEALVQGWGRRELTPWLARTCLLKAQALRTLGNHEAALALCDRVITLWDRLDNRKRRREMRADLAAARLEKGLVLRDRGNRRAALPLIEKAVELGRQLVEEEGQVEPANDLAHAMLALAGLQANIGQGREALELCDEAIALRRRLVTKEERHEVEGDLARAYVTRANVLRAREDPKASLPLYQQAIALYEHLIHDDGRDDLTGDLARAYVANGHAVRVLGEPARAAELCGKATALLEQLVHQQGRSDLQHELARAYHQQGNALRLSGQGGVSLLRCDQAIAVWERLVHREQRPELGNDLARAYIGKAHTLRQLGQAGKALELYDRAIGLREALLDTVAHEDIAVDLARDRVSRAELLAELGDAERARGEIAGASAKLESVVQQTGRGDLKGVLARARRLQARLTPAEPEEPT